MRSCNLLRPDPLQRASVDPTQGSADSLSPVLPPLRAYDLPRRRTPLIPHPRPLTRHSRPLFPRHSGPRAGIHPAGRGGVSPPP